MPARLAAWMAKTPEERADLRESRIRARIKIRAEQEATALARDLSVEEMMATAESMRMVADALEERARFRVSWEIAMWKRMEREAEYPIRGEIG